MINTESTNPTITRFVAIVLFVVPGVIIGAATYISFLSPDIRTIMKVGMAIISLAAWLIFRRRDHLQPYTEIAISYFAISIGVLLAQFYGNMPLKLSGYSVATVQGVATAKFGEALFIVLPILILHFATGGNRSSIFLGVEIANWYWGLESWGL